MSDCQQDLVYLQECKDNANAKIDILTLVVWKQQKVMETMQSQLVELRRRSMMNNILLHNVQEEKDKDVVMVVRQTLPLLGLNEDYDLEHAHCMGALRKDSSIVMHLNRQDVA